MNRILENCNLFRQVQSDEQEELLDNLRSRKNQTPSKPEIFQFGQRSYT